jgi:small subunit ribosomal protein S3
MEELIIDINTSRPGVVIGKKGGEIEKIKRELKKIVNQDVKLNVVEVKQPDLDAQLVATSVTQQLEKRIMFRKAMKRAVQNTMRQGAKGIRIEVSGRLNGAEIARSEWYREGRVPLHTIKADIDYATSEALTTYGILGVKVWIYRGDK